MHAASLTWALTSVISTDAVNDMTKYMQRWGRPQAPVAEGGPSGFSDGGSRRDWFPGVRGLGPAPAPTTDYHIIYYFRNSN